MFVCNVKLNSKKIIKFSLVIIAIIVVIFFIISLYKILNSNFTVDDEIKQSETVYIKAEEYTNILKSVYENLDTYVGQKICFSGYVYRNLDFSENQFVLARDMLVENSTKTLIVGFMCSSSENISCPDGTWVEIVGEISKGNYHGEIPIIRINKINIIDKPANEYAYPPDSTYIPTGVLY